ncbi:MAG: twin-arginine translocase TatA/TatE family subunit [Proteobacteria bacterium]|nr:MAG: twin-arginine translocase TatA/TatE family subunit [Pseudomonadota bacterium]
MFGMSVGHMIVVGVIVLLFGGNRLPGLGSAAGKGIRAFKRGLAGEPEESDPAELSGPAPKQISSSKPKE